MEEIDNPLDASSLEVLETTYETEFIQLISNIYKCYQLIVNDKVQVPKNDENGIRDILLLDYINQTQIRHYNCNIFGYRFEKEVDVNDGRVDIKIHTLDDFEEFDAYFVIECKRLDGSNKLNKAYVNDGIKRFTTPYKSTSVEYYYPSYYGINGMIGFIVKQIDIDNNTKDIPEKFNLIKKNICYESNHENVKLFHLMMDFS